MGRSTYDVIAGFERWPFAGKSVVVLSSKRLTPLHGEEFIASDVQALCRRLGAEGAVRIYVDGGTVIRQFLAADLLDDLTLSILPWFFGGGIPLFASGAPERSADARIYAVISNGSRANAISARARTVTDTRRRHSVAFKKTPESRPWCRASVPSNRAHDRARAPAPWQPAIPHAPHGPKPPSARASMMLRPSPRRRWGRMDLDAIVDGPNRQPWPRVRSPLRRRRGWSRSKRALRRASEERPPRPHRALPRRSRVALGQRHGARPWCPLRHQVPQAIDHEASG